MLLLGALQQDCSGIRLEVKLTEENMILSFAEKFVMKSKFNNEKRGAFIKKVP